jgi:hypothetical protein
MGGAHRVENGLREYSRAARVRRLIQQDIARRWGGHFL